MAHSAPRTVLAHASSAGNPISIGSVTINPGETAVVLMLKVVGATDRAGGAPRLSDYTLVQRNSTQKAATNPEASAELWDVLNPLPGTYTLVIPNTGAVTVWYGLQASAAADGCHSDIDTSTGANATGANPSPGAMTLSQDGNVSFAVVATGAQTWNPSAQAGTAINNTDDGATGTGRQYALAGQGALTLGWTFGTSDDYGAVAASYKEVPANAMNNFARIGGSASGATGVG